MTVEIPAHWQIGTHHYDPERQIQRMKDLKTLTANEAVYFACTWALSANEATKDTEAQGILNDIVDMYEVLRDREKSWWWRLWYRTPFGFYTVTRRIRRMFAACDVLAETLRKRPDYRPLKLPYVNVLAARITTYAACGIGDGMYSALSLLVATFERHAMKGLTGEEAKQARNDILALMYGSYRKMLDRRNGIS